MRFQKAIIIDPPNPPGYVSNKDSMGGFGQLYPKGAAPFPPLDIPYLAGYLAQRGIAAQVIEAGALHLSAEQLSETLHEVLDRGRAPVPAHAQLPGLPLRLQLSTTSPRSRSSSWACRVTR